MAPSRILRSPLARCAAVGLLVLLTASSASAAVSPTTIGSKRTCIYSASSVSTLNATGAMLGVPFNCALVFDDAAQTWAQWDDPWFITDPDPDGNWAQWVQASPGRTMILSIQLIPSNLDGTSWLGHGADGAYNRYAKTLARNLVTAGLGGSVIRLAPEANGTWEPDSIGNTPASDANWAHFWRDTANAMMSVPGADFSFDWSVNAAVRNIPLANYYPGDAVVNEIGIDLYDEGLPSTVTDRWTTLYNEPGSLGTVLAFAQAHGKPISIPEWGVGPTTVQEGGGDDPGYVQGLASVVENDNVAYQSYFFNGTWAQGLASYPNSLAAYQAAFATHSDTGTPSQALATLSPPLPLL
jgi:hypothetical protein